MTLWSYAFIIPILLLQNYKQIKIRLDEFDGYELKGGWFRQNIIFKIKPGKANW